MPTCKGEEDQDKVRKREKWTARGERQMHKVKTSKDDTRWLCWNKKKKKKE